MRVGLVGAGYILDAHARALRSVPGVEIAAICDVVMERAGAAAGRLGNVMATDSLDRMLGLDLDAVHVLVPADRHFDVIRQALAAGVHVLAEKPFVLSGEQARELGALARSSRKTLAVNHNFLFGSAYEAMRTDCEQGRFGPLEQVTATWRFPMGQLQAGPFGGWLTASPGNLFHELGPHLVAFGVDLAGPLEVESVSVSDPITLPGGHRTFRSWQVRASSGRTRVDLDLSARQGAPERSVRIRGLAGSAECHFDRNLYLVSEQRSLNPMFDDLIDGCGRTLSMGRQVAGNFARALGGSLRRGPDANAYGSTFRRSVAAFYRSTLR